MGLGKPIQNYSENGRTKPHLSRGSKTSESSQTIENYFLFSQKKIHNESLLPCSKPSVSCPRLQKEFLQTFSLLYIQYN